MHSKKLKYKFDVDPVKDDQTDSAVLNSKLIIIYTNDFILYTNNNMFAIYLFPEIVCLIEV